MQQRLQVLPDVLPVAILDVPVQRVLDALLDGVLGFPPQQFLGPRRVRSAMTHALGLVGHVVDLLGLPVEMVEDDLDGLLHRHVPADAGVDRRPVGDVLRSQPQCPRDVLHVGEIAGLLAVTPDPEWILSGVGLRHERDDGVGFVLSGAVGGEDAHRAGVDVVLFLVGL